ncbi:MAG: response regulator [Acidobacteria bacterium]|nr:response regulator [Acidobacteriota bacterium]
MTRILLVDDEQPARARLRRLLESMDGVEICGEAADGPAALEQVRNLKPNVVLLDIEMPGCSGTEVAASLPEPRPRIIFCTAFDHYAVEAFELNAADYVLKPVSRARLEAALRKAAPAPQTAAHAQRLLARAGERYVVIPVAEITLFLSEQGLTHLYTNDRDYWMEPTLNDLETRLDPAQFFRISRSALIRMDEVKDVAPMPGGSGEVTLKAGRRLEVSRRRFRDLLERLEFGSR